MRRPRVGIVVTQLGYGGAEKQTYEMVRRLKETSWAPVAIYCLSGQLEPYKTAIEQEGYRVHVLDRASSFDPIRLLQLRQQLKRDGITIVHAVHLLASAYAWIATRGLPDVVVLPTMRGTVVRPGRLRTAVYRRMLASSPRILANSHSGSEFLIRNFCADPAAVMVVPNGIDFALLRELHEPARLRSELGLASTEQVIGFVGRNSRVKNVARFLDVFRRIRTLRPNVKAVLIGHGLGEDARQSLAADLPRSVAFFLGPRQDVPTLLSGLDALVLTSDSEGCPNVVLEALAVGTPVVASNVGDVARMISPGLGYVVCPQDIAGYVAAIGSLLDTHSKSRELLDASRTLAPIYGMQAMVESTLRVWRDCAAIAENAPAREPARISD